MNKLVLNYKNAVIRILPSQMNFDERLHRGMTPDVHGMIEVYTVDSIINNAQSVYMMEVDFNQCLSYVYQVLLNSLPKQIVIHDNVSKLHEVR